jgi:protein-S-isoprenylcysteine O-methyltransferase Ste14
VIAVTDTRHESHIPPRAAARDPRIAGLARLTAAALRPPSGAGRIALALAMGAVCHAVFAAAVLAMVVAMFFGLSESFGRVPWPWAALANAALIVQFPLVHSALLTGGGMRLLARLVPGRHGATLATTTYALIASAQLLALFALWTPSGIVWWRAEGAAFWAICAAYAASWLLLMKASFDAGAEVQSGALGWMSLMARVRPRFPDMPTHGLFAVIRQPIYVAFALTLWTVPVWTPDQLALAVSYTAYCLLAPRLKERRFAARYGPRFARYRARVPYVVPKRRRRDAQ